ncbi:electron carrier/ protein disulfide oxidoreductase [Anaeramoeba flamelloides]|uniref:Electron carrier/ protein disulfide oxidoreductase n=1 Tax=Anaeramoeba flamelloides TaxID=1746091 RepID=A0ABQ8ZFP0_9EUKA|nr:electron carrier/ protein disulfide oxidoreductase [Anaeramoeba flamelloides]
MGNDLDTSNVTNKVTLKSFQNRINPTNSKNRVILHVSQTGMIIGFSEKCSKLFSFSSTTQKVSFQSFCPSFQVYLNDSISNLLPTLAKSAVNSPTGSLDLVWLFKVRILHITKQIETKKQKEKKGKNNQNQNQNQNGKEEKEEEKHKKQKNQKKDKLKKKENNYLKNTKNSQYFWSFLTVQPFLVKGDLFFEIVLKPTFKPIELLRKRKLILKVKQKNLQIEEKIQKLKKKMNNSFMSQQTSKTQETLRDFVNQNNQKTKILNNMNLKIKQIQSDISNREPNSKKYEKEKQKLVKQIRSAENQLSFELNKFRHKQLNTSIVTRLNSLRLQSKSKEEERQKIKIQIKENTNKIAKQKNRLLKMEKKKSHLIYKSEQFQKLLKKKKSLAQNQKDADKEIKWILKKLKKNVISQNIQEEISKTSNQLKKLSKIRNSLIRELDRLKNILKIQKSNFSNSSSASSSGDLLTIIEQRPFVDENKKRNKNEPEFFLKKSSIKKINSSKTQNDLITTSYQTKLQDEKQMSESFSNPTIFKYLKKIDSQKLISIIQSFRPLPLKNQSHHNESLPSKSTGTKEKNNQNKKKNKLKKYHSIKDEYQLITLDEILKIPIALEFFREFLSERMVPEALLFYLDLQQFHQVYNEQNAHRLIEHMIDYYLETTSIFSLDLKQETREKYISLWENENYSKTIFDSLGKKIKKLLEEKYLREFQKSYLHTELSDLEISKNEKFCSLSYFQLGLTFGERSTESLNTTIEIKKAVLDPFKFSSQLVNTLIEALDDSFWEGLGTIDLNKLQQSILFKKFLVEVPSLCNIDLNILMDSTNVQKTIFFINIFNTITVHSLIVNMFPESQITYKQFLNQSKYNIGGFNFSLALIKSSIFGLLDPNSESKKVNLPSNLQKLYINNLDPRIHFTLISPTEEAPSLKSFTEENYGQEIIKSTTFFLKKYFQINHKKKKIFIPFIFENYCHHFGENHFQILLWIRAFLKFDNIFDLYSYKFIFASQKFVNQIIFPTNHNKNEKMQN